MEKNLHGSRGKCTCCGCYIVAEFEEVTIALFALVGYNLESLLKSFYGFTKINELTEKLALCNMNFVCCFAATQRLGWC